MDVKSVYMSSESENNQKLKDFFNQEYKALRTYVNTKISTSINYEPEDIIQDVALKLFTGADRYSPINNVAGFVYRALKNKIIDVMRTTKTKKVSTTDNMEKPLFAFAELLYDTEQHAYSYKMEQELKKAILSLSEDYKDIIIAVDFEGYSYKEISFETGVPVGTLMSRRHRAISQLYKKLKTSDELTN